MKDKRQREKRGPWYLLTGLFLGLVVGLIFSTLILPVEYVDIPPSELRGADKDRLRALIALAYQANHDLGRAKARLALLQDVDSARVLSSQAQQMQAGEGNQKEAKALALLASDLSTGMVSTTVAQGVPTLPSTDQGANADPAATVELGQVIQTPTQPPTQLPTSLATFTPRPSTTPAEALTLPFAMESRKENCSPDGPQGLLQVEVHDADGQPLAGAKIVITWDGGEETFFTGLHPEVSLGYADYSMEPTQQYRLRVGDGGKVVEDLKAPKCKKPDGSTYPGGLKLTFAP